MSHREHHSHTRTYITIWGILLVLTAVTVAVSYYDFGTFNILVAMLVATIKGSLVCLYFMHLKEDNRFNQVAFVSSFVFLAIFVALTASDELYRVIDKPVAIAKVQEKIELNQFLQSTPELVAKGKEIYSVQCAVCHGPAGKGDGPGGASADPKPRDFTSGYWRYSGGVIGIANTIAKGSPGTAMPSFTNLSASDRFALAHYVRSFGSNPVADKSEDVETAKKLYSAAPGAAQTQATQKIPVSFAMKELSEPLTTVEEGANTTEEEPQTLGASLYQASCMSCHGVKGRGGVRISVVTSQPPAYLTTADFSKSKESWQTSLPAFIERVSKGNPGKSKPGISHFTNEEWQALYQEIKRLGE